MSTPFPTPVEANRAGRILADSSFNPHAPEYLEALGTLHAWRALHVDMLRSMRQIVSLPENAGPFTIAFRVKRTASIIAKLRRFPNLHLSRMQDIVGFRIILESENTAEAAFQQFDGFLHRCRATWLHTWTPTRMKNYILNPKSSGYRSFHTVFQYPREEKSPWNGLQVELQFRTWRQHLWAMAVETVEMITGEPLKASQGDYGWLEFFQLAGAVMSRQENAPVPEQFASRSLETLQKELCAREREKRFLQKLKDIRKIGEVIPHRNGTLWLLVNDPSAGKASFIEFNHESRPTAQQVYDTMDYTEEIRLGRKHVVLVETHDPRTLRKAYPSYFLDVTEFTELFEPVRRVNDLPPVEYVNDLSPVN
jgi:ppGpp synthetase/RelA/SpoT-type nucleotidyltranferase